MDRLLATADQLKRALAANVPIEELYERYLGYWKDGQIDRAEVARAGQRLAALRPRPAA